MAELDERAYLADKLEADVNDLPDDMPYDGSQQPALLSADAVLAVSDQVARASLKRFVESAALLAQLNAHDLHWPGQPFRVSEDKFEHRTPEGDWVDLTSYITGVDTLNREFNELVSLSRAFGNALYSQPFHDIRQVLDHKGLGSPRTAGETRNIISWLRSALPPAPPLGNYAGLMQREWAPGLLTASDKALIKTLASERWSGEYRQDFACLDDLPVLALQENPGAHLDKLLNSEQALDFGERLARALKWPQEPFSKTLRQQLVIAALTVHADPDAPSEPGHVAGYDLYQPANMGLALGAVRGHVEQHLVDKRGVDPKLAVLTAHIGLAQAAPEFLVKDVPLQIRIGTPAWAERRLGLQWQSVPRPVPLAG